MPFINFKTVNAKNHKDGNVKKKLKYGLSTYWDFSH